MLVLPSACIVTENEGWARRESAIPEKKISKSAPGDAMLREAIAPTYHYQTGATGCYRQHYEINLDVVDLLLLHTSLALKNLHIRMVQRGVRFDSPTSHHRNILMGSTSRQRVKLGRYIRTRDPI